MKSADALFTAQPVIKNGRIESPGEIWVIMNSSQEEIEDFFREGLDFACDELFDIPIKDDPKPVMCLRLRGGSTVVMQKASLNTDFLLSKIISAHFNEI